MKKSILLLLALALICALPLGVGATDGTGTGSTSTADPVAVVVISLFIGLAVGLTVTLLMKRAMSTVRKQKRADSYTRMGSFSLEESRDLFLYSTVTRVRVNTNNKRN